MKLTLYYNIPSFTTSLSTEVVYPPYYYPEFLRFLCLSYLCLYSESTPTLPEN